MRIERTQLVAELHAFACSGNGVVVGPPGVGKSYTLGDLRQRLKQDGTLHLILPVERLGQGTDGEIQAVLRRDGDFIDLLRSAAVESRPPAILIFDGFDAARGELERAGILRLIIRAVTELHGIWNTIVSVRTFDAKKSERLLKLFPSDTAGSADAGISCRHFVIPPFGPAELEQAFQQIPGLRELHAGGSQEFLALLTVPFNLWLIERVLRAGVDPAAFSRVTSEVQLLELYWKHRVRQAPGAEDRESILSTATRAMVSSHTLTVRRDRVYRPETRAAWENLLSNELLSEVEEREPRVAFAHNILFDFAVSVLLLETEPSKLAEFIAEEPARPLFLRPSLVYHFTRLWHFDRDGFWRNFWGVIQREEMHLRQIIRIVLPAVIVSEARSVTDLSPMLERLARGGPLGSEAVAFLLQGLRVLESERAALWTDFIRSTTPYLDRRFAWDAGSIALHFIDTKKTLLAESIAACGEFGRRLLAWAWGSRSDPAASWFERLAAVIAIPLVAKTYASDPDESRTLLKRVLEVIDEPGFPIDCIFWLTQEIKPLIAHDHELVGLIYERVFGHEERSEEKTNMGGTVLPLISNRRQDFDGCRFSLLQDFPAFLAAAPLVATAAGLRAVQGFALQRHVLPYLRAGATLDEFTYAFDFRGRESHFLADGSAAWDESSPLDQEIAIADAIFQWLADAAQQGRGLDVDTFLDLFADHAQLAFLWARLLAAGANQPDTLAPRLWELTVAQPILEGFDTLYQLGCFLENAARHFTHEQRYKLEAAIMHLPSAASEEHRVATERLRLRLIARIPPECLETREARDLREDWEQRSTLPPNTPLVSFHASSEPFTEDDFLREQGARPDSPENRAVRTAYAPLKEWTEKGKDESQIDSLLKPACRLRDMLAAECDAEAAVVSAAWRHLADFASEAAGRTKTSGTERFRILRELLLQAATRPEPEPDPERDSRWKSAAWSPAPRNEAARALPWLAHFAFDEEVLAAIRKLTTDPVPSVRFLVACELWRVSEHASDAMWGLLDQVAEQEENRVVLHGVTASIWRLIPRQKDRSLSLIQKLVSRVEDAPEDGEGGWRELICMVTDYAVWDRHPWAEQALARWRGAPLEYAAAVAASGHRLIAYVVPQQVRPRLEHARELLLS